MSNPRARLARILALPLPERVRVMHLSGDQERAISLSRLRQLMPPQVELVAGPGCASTICPAADIYQAIRLACDQAVTLLTDETLLWMPGPAGADGPRSLAEAQAAGAGVRTISAPVEAVMLARDRPEREFVLFLAGYETLLVPLAGQLLEGLPGNLSLLVRSRRVEPLFEADDAPLRGFDGLVLPGNRCALVGLADWQRLSAAQGWPAVVAGYSASGLLAALEALLQRVSEHRSGVINCYKSVARPEGNPAALARFSRVFERGVGHWRGRGMVAGSAYRLRAAFAAHDADQRFPDYRHDVRQFSEGAGGYECDKVAYGEMAPPDCAAFRETCRPGHPLGSSMASIDGTCRIMSTVEPPSLLSVVAG